MRGFFAGMQCHDVSNPTTAQSRYLVTKNILPHHIVGSVHCYQLFSFIDLLTSRFLRLLPY